MQSIFENVILHGFACISPLGQKVILSVTGFLKKALLMHRNGLRPL